MILLAIGVLFVALQHLAVAFPGARQRLEDQVGARAFGPVFGLTSLIGVAVIVLGWNLSGFVAVYDPPAWGRHANFAFMLVAFLCFGIFLFRGSLRQRLRFPMAYAAMFWASGHLLANGDLRSLILFGGLLAYAAAHLAIGIANGVRPSPEVRVGHDLISLLAGLALYGVMTQLHPILIGVPVFDISAFRAG